MVLQGCAEFGKTAVVHKFMFDWTIGMIIPDRFKYLIYINFREISHIANLITNNFQDVDGIILDVVIMYSEKLLFILDGFSELWYPIGDEEEDLSANSQEKSVETLWYSFVRKKMFPRSSLLITAHSTTMKKLHSLLKQAIQAEILWFTYAEIRTFKNCFIIDSIPDVSLLLPFYSPPPRPYPHTPRSLPPYCSCPWATHILSNLIKG